MADVNGQKYADTVLKTGWQNDPSLVEYYDDKVNDNVSMMNANIARFKRGEVYIEQTSQIDNIVELEAEENQRVIQFDVQETLSESSVVVAPATGTYTFDISDGTARLAAVSYDIHE